LREVRIANIGLMTRESALVRLARQKDILVVRTEFIAEVRQVAAQSRILLGQVG